MRKVEQMAGEGQQLESFQASQIKAHRRSDLYHQIWYQQGSAAGVDFATVLAV
jgi:hypothetical protein